MKTNQIQCPYCGANAVLKSAAKMYGRKAREPNRYLYVCANWPVCNSYVMAHMGDLQPMGTMANAELRHKRIMAHKTLQAYQKVTHTTKWASYIWLEGKLGLDQQRTHIGMFSAEECDRVIDLCRNEIAVFRKSRMGGVAS